MLCRGTCAVVTLPLLVETGLSEFSGFGTVRHAHRGGSVIWRGAMRVSRPFGAETGRVGEQERFSDFAGKGDADLAQPQRQGAIVAGF